MCKAVLVVPKSTFSLNSPPLLCVVARVQFAPIAKIKEYAAELQEDLRLKGYSHFEIRKTKGVYIQQNAEGGTKVDVSEVPQWIIANRDSKVSLRVDGKGISILFGRYTKFQEARPQYEELLRAIEEQVKGIVCQEFQLRYINYIALGEAIGPDERVRPGLLGLPNVDGLRRRASVSETSYQAESGGALIVRCSAMPQGLALPPDLLPLEVEPDLPLQSKQPFILLENLRSKKAVKPEFSAHCCLSEFELMRAEIHTAFQKTVTEEALAKWK